MLFKLSYSIPVELLKECQERFKSGEEKTDGLKVIGRWHEVGKTKVSCSLKQTTLWPLGHSQINGATCVTWKLFP